MTNKLSKSPGDWREGRRLRAWELYQKGWKQTQIAEAFGFCGQVWTLTRVAEVIRREFGVVYHPGHVRRILRAIGWTRQKPVRRASQRHEAAIQRWRSEDWPQGEKKP